MTQTALITGASSGIGASFARRLAADGYHLILVARRADKLEALAAEVTANRSIRAEVIPADLSRPEAPGALLEAVTARGLTVDLLINNAGIGAHGPFEATTHDDDQRMIDLNISSLTAMTRAFLPGMLERRSGAVINVASTAAFQAIPYFAVYAATKAYVLAFSEALAEEVADRGVKIVCLCPGPTATEFNDVAGVSKLEAAKKAPTMTADAVAAEGLAGLKAGRVVQVAGLVNAFGASAGRLMPRQWVAKAAGLIFNPNR
ncbi:MAG: SDR family NAD(P)-dependent oxidoreductase [Candidatus Sericytochromatia bacterium]